MMRSNFLIQIVFAIFALLCGGSAFSAPAPPMIQVYETLLWVTQGDPTASQLEDYLATLDRYLKKGEGQEKDLELLRVFQANLKSALKSRESLRVCLQDESLVRDLPARISFSPAALCTARPGSFEVIHSLSRQIQKAAAPPSTKEQTAATFASLAVEGRRAVLNSYLDFQLKMLGSAALKTLSATEVIRDLFETTPAGGKGPALETGEKNELLKRIRMRIESAPEAPPVSKSLILGALNLEIARVRDAQRAIPKPAPPLERQIAAVQTGAGFTGELGRRYGGAGPWIEAEKKRIYAQYPKDFFYRDRIQVAYDQWIQKEMGTLMEDAWGLLLFTPTVAARTDIPLTHDSILRPRFSLLPEGKEGEKQVEKSISEALDQIRAEGRKISSSAFSVYGLSGQKVPAEQLQNNLSDFLVSRPYLLPLAVQNYPAELSTYCDVMNRAKARQVVQDELRERSQNLAMGVAGGLGVLSGGTFFLAEAAPIGAWVGLSAGASALSLAASASSGYAIYLNSEDSDVKLKRSQDLRSAFFGSGGQDFSRYLEMKKTWQDYEKARILLFGSSAGLLVDAAFLPSILGGLSAAERLASLRQSENLLGSLAKQPKVFKTVKTALGNEATLKLIHYCAQMPGKKGLNLIRELSVLETGTLKGLASQIQSPQFTVSEFAEWLKQKR